MSMININDLYLEKQEKEKNKKNIYDNVLQKCHNKIVTSSKTNPYDQWCYFVIPKFIYGIPLYNQPECINYLVTHLTKNGFTISYTHPNLLIITWFKENSKLIQPKSIFPNSNNNFKSINDYKPSGNLIYNKNSLNILNNKKNNLLNS